MKKNNRERMKIETAKKIVEMRVKTQRFKILFMK